MKIKNIIAIAFALVALKGNCQKETFKITGRVTNDYDGYIYLSYGNTTDSTRIEENGFAFGGSVDYPIEARLHTKNGLFGGYLFLENSAMAIEISITNNDTYLNSVKGSKTHVLMEDMLAYFEQIQSDSDFASLLFHKLDTLITENPRNQFSGLVLSEVAMDPILTFEQVSSLYSKLDTSVQDKEYMELLKISMDKLKNIKIGNDFISFGLPDINGKVIHVEDYKNGFLLVEFWSSYCRPCRMSNPRLVEIYHKYNDAGFDIFGISLDLDQTAWLNAIEKDSLVWANTIAKGGFDNQIVQELGIQYIPSNYLIDKNGKILAINIKPAELEKKLSELLEK